MTRIGSYRPLCVGVLALQSSGRAPRLKQALIHSTY